MPDDRILQEFDDEAAKYEEETGIIAGLKGVAGEVGEAVVSPQETATRLVVEGIPGAADAASSWVWGLMLAGVEKVEGDIRDRAMAQLPDDPRQAAQMAEQIERRSRELPDKALGFVKDVDRYWKKSAPEAITGALGGGDEAAAIVRSDIPEMPGIGAESVTTIGSILPYMTGAPALPVAFAQEFGGRYKDLRMEGVDEKSARSVAAVTASVVTATTAMFGNSGAEKLTQLLRKGALKKMSIKGITWGALMEGVEETTQDFVNGMVEAKMLGRKNRTTASDLVKTFFLSTLVGAVGEGIGGVGEVANRSRSEMAEDQMWADALEELSDQAALQAMAPSQAQMQVVPMEQAKQEAAGEEAVVPSMQEAEEVVTEPSQQAEAPVSEPGTQAEEADQGPSAQVESQPVAGEELVYEDRKSTPEEIQREIADRRFQAGKARGKARRSSRPASAHEFASAKEQEARALEEQFQDWAEKNPEQAAKYEARQEKIANSKPGDFVTDYFDGMPMRVESVNRKSLTVMSPNGERRTIRKEQLLPFDSDWTPTDTGEEGMRAWNDVGDTWLAEATGRWPELAERLPPAAKAKAEKPTVQRERVRNQALRAIQSSPKMMQAMAKQGVSPKQYVDDLMGVVDAFAGRMGSDTGADNLFRRLMIQQAKEDGGEGAANELQQAMADAENESARVSEQGRRYFGDTTRARDTGIQLELFTPDMQLAESEPEVSRGETSLYDDPRLVDIARGVGVVVKPGDSLRAAVTGYVESDGATSFDVVGQEAGSIEGIAELFQVIRSPAAERLAWLLTDESGQVVHSGLYSVGTIDGAAAPADEGSFAHIADVIRQVPGSRLVLAHNHPSGNVTPSRGDNYVYGNVERMCRDIGVEFSGLVLDHGKATAWNGGSWVGEVGYKVDQDFRRPESPVSLTGIGEVIDQAAKIYLDGEGVLLMHTSARNRVIGVDVVPRTEPGIIGEMRTRHHAARTFVVGSEGRVKAEHGDRRTVDMVEIKGKDYYSLRAAGQFQPANFPDMDRDTILAEVREDAPGELYRPAYHGTGNPQVYDALLTQYVGGVGGQAGGGARGSLELKDGDYLVRLFDGADLSTLVHETAHVFLEEIRSAIAADAAPAGMDQDWQVLERWWGSNWADMSMEQKRAAHESFATAFEAYLAEGRAPTEQLQGVFDRFKGWLAAVYQSVKDLIGRGGDVTLTDDVRGVFDRMLGGETDQASDTAMDEAPMPAEEQMSQAEADARAAEAEAAAAAMRGDRGDGALEETPDGPDVLNMVEQAGGIMPKGSYRGGEYDDKPRLGRFTRPVMQREGMRPDEMARILDGQGFGDGTVVTMWREIRDAVEHREALEEEDRLRREAAQERRERDALPSAKAKAAAESEKTGLADEIMADIEEDMGEEEMAAYVEGMEDAPFGVERDFIRSGQQATMQEHASGRIEPAPLPAGTEMKVRNLRDMINSLANDLGVTSVRVKKMPRGSGGYYLPSGAVVALRTHESIDTAAHEIAGHWIDDRVGLLNAYRIKAEEAEDYAILEQKAALDGELSVFWPYGSSPRADMEVWQQRNYMRGEGIAEFMRAWIINPEQTERIAPMVTGLMKAKVPAEILERIGQFGMEFRAAFHAGVMELGAANVRRVDDLGPSSMQRAVDGLKSFRDKPTLGQPFKLGAANWMSTRLLDSLNPLIKGIRWGGEQTGQKSEAERAEDLIRLHAGIHDKLGAIADYGMIQADWLGTGEDGKPIVKFAPGVDGGIESLIRPLKQDSYEAFMQEQQEFGLYMTAQAQIEMADRIDRERIEQIQKMAAEVELYAEEGRKILEAQAHAMRIKAGAQKRGVERTLAGRIDKVRTAAEVLGTATDADLATIIDAAAEIAAIKPDKVKASGIEAMNRRVYTNLERMLGTLDRVFMQTKEHKGTTAIRQKLGRLGERIGKLQAKIAEGGREVIGEVQEEANALAQAASDALSEQISARVSTARARLGKRQDRLTRDILGLYEAIDRAVGQIDKRTEAEINALSKRLEARIASKMRSVVRWGRRQALADERRKNKLTGLGGAIRGDMEQAEMTLKAVMADRSKMERFSVAAERYRAWADGALRYMVDKGKMSEELYQQIKANNEFYVNLSREMDEEDGAGFRPVGGGKLGSAANVIKKRRGSLRMRTDPIAAMIENSMRMVEEADRNEALRSAIDIFTGRRDIGEGKPLDLGSVAVRLLEKEKDAVTIWRNGEEEYWKFAPEIQAAIKGISEQYALPAILRMHATILRTTIVNTPMFAIRNTIRDTFHRWMLGEGDIEGAAQEIVRLAKQLPYTRGQKERERMIVEFAGAAFSGHYAHGEKNWHSEQVKRSKQMAREGTIIGSLANMGGLYKKAIESSEFTGRAVEFWRLYDDNVKAGMDERSAMIAAAAATRGLIDFAVSGTWVRVVNQMVPFLNATVQGGAVLVRGAKERPMQVLPRWVLYSAMPSILVYLANAFLGDDDDLEEYVNLPRWRRDLYWSFKIGNDSWLSIPKPHEAGVIGTTAERLVEAVHRSMKGEKDAWERAFSGHLGSVLETASPIDQSTFLGSFGPLIEVWMNRSIFTGKPIVSQWEEDLPVSKRKGTQYASRIGNFFQAASLNNLDARQADHLIRQTFGNVGQGAMLASDLGREDKTAHAMRMTNFLSGITKSGPGPWSVDVDRFLESEKAAGRPRSKPVQVLQDMRSRYYEAHSAAERDAVAREMRAYARGEDPMMRFDRAYSAANKLMKMYKEVPKEGKAAFKRANADALEAAGLIRRSAKRINKMRATDEDAARKAAEEVLRKGQVE